MIRRVAAIVFLAAPPLLMLIACGLNAWAGRPWADPLLWAPLAFACAAVGSLLWVRRAGGAIAGLFIYMGIGLPIGILVEAYTHAATQHGLAGASWAAVLFQASLALTLSFYLILQLFPTGAPLSPRWRILVWLTVGAGVLVFLTSALGATSEFKNNFPGIAHPLDVLPARITQALDDIGGMATIVLFLASAVEIVLRYRRSTGDQRAQMKWFAGAAAIAAGGFLAGFVLRPDDPSLAFALLTPLIPIAAGIAILQYRLYDIDVVISKTVVVALLAVFIAAVYIAIVVGIGSLAGSTTSPALSIAATVLVAVLFQPVRLRARRLANRLVYGERATPYEVIAGFSERVADAVSTDRVLPQMAEAAGRGVGAVEASVRVRLPGGLERTEHWSGPVVDPGRVGAPWTVTVGYQGSRSATSSSRSPPTIPLLRRSRTSSAISPRRRGWRCTTSGCPTSSGSGCGSWTSRPRRCASRASAWSPLATRSGAASSGTSTRGPSGSSSTSRQRLRPGCDRPGRAGRVDRGQRTTTLDGLRDLARGIFPPLLAEQGIVAALRAHIRKVGANATVEAAIGFADRRFDADTEAGVYFCCLQAIQNVIRHARQRCERGRPVPPRGRDHVRDPR